MLRPAPPHPARAVLLGSLAGTLVGWAVFAALLALLPAPQGSPSVADRLAMAVKLNAAPAVLLLVMTIVMGQARLLKGAIDPLRDIEPYFVTVTGRVLTNSLEQSVIFFLLSAAVALLLPVPWLIVLPAGAIVFVLARLTFWAGYLIQPRYRAAGMALTYELNVALVVALLYMLIRGH